ncbi:MAG: DNA repair exonuclease [Clostridia bacterium]|nr:DNA repair exonuclease [Clostridia bacterium]
MGNIRFIHTGDLHLGSPLKAVGKISDRLQKSLMDSSYRAIEKIIEAAVEYDVDFVLMCGDIYDDEARSIRGNRFFSDQLEILAKENIPVFIIYGNHDPIGENVNFFKLPKNVIVLGAEDVEMHEVCHVSGRPKARILGQSYGSPSESKKIHRNYKPPVDDLVNIAMLHTGLDPGSNAYVPCSPQELKEQSDIHYWALGHIHSPTMVSDRSPVISYPGIPQGRDVGEKGLKGCFLVEFTSPDDIQMKFIPTSPVIWMVREISIENKQGLENMDHLMDLMIEDSRGIFDTPPGVPLDCPIIGNGYKPEGYVVRWEICGRHPIHDSLISDNQLEIAEALVDKMNGHLASSRPYLYTEGVKFRTGSPIPDLETLLERDETIRTLLEIRNNIFEDENLKEEAVSTMGEIWYKPRSEGDLREDTFPVTDEIFDAILEDAFNMAVERVVKERENC